MQQSKNCDYSGFIFDNQYNFLFKYIKFSNLTLIQRDPFTKIYQKKKKQIL